MSNMKTSMYDICPVCHGDKKIKYRVKYQEGFREMQTSCWACRGSGYIDYHEEEIVSESRIGQMFEALGTM